MDYKVDKLKAAGFAPSWSDNSWLISIAAQQKAKSSNMDVTAPSFLVSVLFYARKHFGSSKYQAGLSAILSRTPRWVYNKLVYRSCKHLQVTIKFLPSSWWHQLPGDWSMRDNGFAWRLHLSGHKVRVKYWNVQWADYVTITRLGPWYQPAMDCVWIISTRSGAVETSQGPDAVPTSEPEVVKLSPTIASSINDGCDNIC